ncbi:MAG: serine/threonine protein kinase [Phycisphaerae bacterium]|nr:serine/threonine protein kinase [Phycisphaerae bacterium]
MPGTRWRRTKTIFHAAIDLPADRRDEFLSGVCNGDASLLSEVRSLLTHHERQGAEHGPPDARSVALAFERAEINARIGSRIGPYELDRLIDAGGMGKVYLAHRVDGQFERSVAIKIIRRGFNNDEMRRRFRNEQRALAALDHPNIARLIDGGITSDDLSYLVMEYVEGRPIDEYCNWRRLSVECRLELFRAVCSAVHYAHQRLVIHRDLKPSNILVTADGIPKLLDFGIAKVMDGQNDGDDAAFTTRINSVPFLTPEYAPPEQLRGEGITTAGDIYSLGVILFELLSGRRPHLRAGRSQMDFAAEICEREPERPSAVCGAAARDRGMQPAALSRRLSGDLDNICLMALRKEPRRRYGSAEQLAEDLRRHLDGRPVIARRDTFGYRAAKFVRRNRLAVLVSTLFLGALVGGLIFAVYTLGEVRRAQDRTLVMNQFLKRMIAEADVNQAGHDLTVLEMLNRAGDRVARDFKEHPDVEAGLHAAIGSAYLSLRLSEAEPHLRAAYEIRRRLYGDRNQDTVDSLHDLAIMHFQKGELDEADRKASAALDAQRSLTGEINESFASKLDDLAVIVRNKGEYQRAEPLYRRALALKRHLFGPSHVETAQTLNNYALLLKLRGDLGRAEHMYREAIDVRRRGGGGEHHALATTLNNLAALLHAKGFDDEAEPLYRESLALQERLLGSEHPSTALTENNLAMLLLSAGRLKEADALFHHSLKAHRERLGERHAQVATLIFNLGSLYQQQARFDEAERLYQQAYEIRRVALGPDHPDVATSLAGLGSLAIDLKRFDEARRFLTDALAIRRQRFPEGHASVAAGIDQLARLNLAIGAVDDAERDAREALALREGHLLAGHPDIGASHVRLGSVLAKRGCMAEARRQVIQGIAILRARVRPGHPALVPALTELGRIAFVEGDMRVARSSLEEALQNGQALYGLQHPDVQEIVAQLEKLPPIDSAVESEPSHRRFAR